MGAAQAMGKAQTTMNNETKGLFERWLEIELKTGRQLGEILADLNAACGTKYTHNWPSVMAQRNYSLTRCPTPVRRYMLQKVLPAELEKLGATPSARQVRALVLSLT